MKLYTVHTQPWSAAADGEAVLIKDGFSWPAFLFTVLWALWRGLWLVAGALLLVELALAGIVTLIGLDPVSSAAIQLGYHLLVGFFANDWRRRTLAARGIVDAGVVAAADRVAAEHRYFMSRKGQLGARA